MSGFIALHREAMNHHLFKGDVARFGAWLWMVSRACWKQTKFDVQGRTITLERGQFCCSVRDMATAWGWPKSNVDRFLTRLKTETMIETHTGTGRLIITICNYAKYQDVKSDTGTPTGTDSGTAAGQQRDIKEQGNKGTMVEEEPNGSPSTPRKSVSEVFPRPEWASPEVWADFLRNRKAKRLPNTATAHRKLLKDIAALVDEDWPPGRLLEEIVARGWGAAFDPRPKDFRYGNGTRNHQQDDEPRNPYVRAAIERQAERAALGQGHADSWSEDGF